MIDGRGSQLDPVRVLQGIFKKQEPKRRRPGVNRIAEKYKKVLKSASASMRDAETRGTVDSFPRSNAFQDGRFS